MNQIEYSTAVWRNYMSLTIFPTRTTTLSFTVPQVKARQRGMSSHGRLRHVIDEKPYKEVSPDKGLERM